MKLKITSTIFILLYYIIASAQHIDKYIVRGEIKGLRDSTKVYLKANLPNRPYSDTLSTTVSKGGKFTLEGAAFNGNQFGFLKIDGIENHLTFIIDFSEPIYINGTVATWPSARIEGSQENKAFLSFWNASSSLKEFSDKLLQQRNDALKVNDSIAVKKALLEYYAVSDSLLKLRKSFYDLHPDALYSAYLIQTTNGLNSREKNDAYAKLTSRVRESFWGMELKKRILIQEKTESIQIGSIVPNFYSTSIDGKTIGLHEIIKKNKYTLIDFWASWCGPCREHTPNIKRVYNQFKSQGFNVLGISFDFKADPWKEAIKTDSMNWDHISDLKGRNGEAHSIFNIDGIPAYLLVNNKGEIIEIDIPHLKDVSTQGANLRAEKLQRKLDELFSTEKSFIETRNKRNEFNQKRIDLLRQLKSVGNDAEASKTLQNELVSHDKMVSNYEDKYIEEHPGAAYSLHLLASKAEQLSLDDLRKRYGALSANVKNGDNDAYVKRIIAERSERLNRDTERVKVIAIGKIAPDFTATDIAGRPLSLKDILKRGELTYVDFWASWCAPCRAETPMVAKTYSEFKSKGLNVISYSVDRDLAAWKKAVKEDNMVWYNVSEPNGGMNQAYDLFYVENSVPATYLLDKHGKILAINLTGDQLYKKVAELLKLKQNRKK